MNNPKKKNDTKIKRQILVLFLISILIPVWGLGGFSIYSVRRQMLEHYEKQLYADNIRIGSTIFDITTSIYTSVESIISDRNNMELFGSDYSAPLHTVWLDSLDTTLSTLRKNNAAISSIHIYTNNPNIPEVANVSYISDCENQQWYKLLPEGTWDSWGFTAHKDKFDTDVYELCLVRKMGVISDTCSAWLVVCLDSNNIRNRVGQNSYDVFAALEDGTCFYASDIHNVSSTMLFPQDFDGGYCSYSGSLTYDGEKRLTNINTSSAYRTDNKFYISVSDREAYDNINSMTTTYLLIILLLTLVPSAVIWGFSSYFSRRVATLKAAMHQASLGDYNIIDHFSGNDDELAETFRDLKITVKQIHEKEALYYEQQIKEQQLINNQQRMEYNMLASQINPHFLYNTLETIRMQALSGDNADVITSIKLLAKSMRYILDNTGTSVTTLDKELEHVKTYLAIQHMRFGDRVNYITEIPEDIVPAEISVLPLLLQPIVENSVIHSLEEIEEHGVIRISAHRDGEYLEITVADNGIGMDEAQLDRIRKQLTDHEANTRSIGLYNTNQRIKLCYGSAYGLSIDSVLNRGTVVTLRLPYTPVNNET